MASYAEKIFEKLSAKQRGRDFAECVSSFLRNALDSNYSKVGYRQGRDVEYNDMQYEVIITFFKKDIDGTVENVSIYYNQFGFDVKYSDKLTFHKDKKITNPFMGDFIKTIFDNHGHISWDREEEIKKKLTVENYKKFLINKRFGL